MGVLSALNAIFHVPILGDYIVYAYWYLMLLLAPFVGLGIIVYDHLSGHIWTIARNKVEGDQAVLITGCDRGFGRALAVRCVALGFKTYAACLTKEGAEELKAEAPGVHTVLANVTDPAALQAMADRIEAENPKGLYALVNNAGMTRTGPFDWLSVSDYKAIMEVNFFGTINVIKAVLPLVKKSEGRIINVSSITALTCGSLCSSPYGASKHALEYFTSTLRMELKPFNVKVITVSPGFHRTELTATAGKRTQEQYAALSPGLKAQYPETYAKGTEQMLLMFGETLAQDPKYVTQTLEQALVSRWPRILYSVGLDARCGASPFIYLPKRVCEPLLYYLMPSGMRTVNNTYAAAAPTDAGNRV